MRSKISLKKIPEYIKNSSISFHKQIHENGGGSYHCRAVVAQILLFSLYYLITVRLIPIKDAINAHLILATSWIAIMIVWQVVKEKIYPWIKDVCSGEIFYNLDITALNVSILTLFLLNFIIIFIPLNLKTNKDD